MMHYVYEQKPINTEAELFLINTSFFPFVSACSSVRLSNVVLWWFLWRTRVIFRL